MRHKLAAAFVIAGAACTAGIIYPAGEIQAVTFKLNSATSLEAAGVLRTIAGARTLEIADDHTITVRDTPETLELAAAVVKMLDAADDTADTPPLTTKDGSVLVTVLLDRALAEDVMLALRKELRIARVARAGERRLLLRDTDRQIQAAREVIARLERSHEDS